ncbi:MAG: type II secretion system protein GspG [Candidatus Margulisbacteria bacterium]|nr:type II secretion system protein GspG [Candidatus Margulisiibacteriota bacterium]
MQNDAWLAKAAKEIQTIQIAVESFYRHNNRYPAGLNELLNARPAILDRLPGDPWQTAVVADEDGLEYKTYGYLTGYVPGGAEYYVIYSKGIDGIDDTAAASPQNNKLTLPAGSDDIVQSSLQALKR